MSAAPEVDPLPSVEPPGNTADAWFGAPAVGAVSSGAPRGSTVGRTSLCKPCGIFDATPATILPAPGTCAICGRYGPLYSCPARPLPGIQEASR